MCTFRYMAHEAKEENALLAQSLPSTREVFTFLYVSKEGQAVVQAA